MPLDNVGRRYADQLFQESLESILKSQGLELANVARDYAGRNMTLSGAYFTAQAAAFIRNAELLTQARVDSLLRAYEKSGTALDDATMQEIASEATQFCEQQGRNIVQNLQNRIRQSFGSQAPSGFSEAIAEQVLREVSGISARVTRRLSIMRDAAVLEAGTASAGRGAARPAIDSKSSDEESHRNPIRQPPEAAHSKPRLYYWRLCKKFGAECYHTWRAELLASFIVSLASYWVSKGDDPLAWRNFKVVLIATVFTLGAFALWHLVRAPWLVHRRSIGIEQTNEHWGFGVLGVALIAGVLVGAYFSGLYLVEIYAGPLAVKISPPPAPQLVSPVQRDVEKTPKLHISDNGGPLNGRVFQEDEKGNIDLPVLRLTNVGNLAVQQASIRVYFSQAVVNVAGPTYQPTPSDDPRLPFELYLGGAIQINPGEPWSMPPLTLRRAVASENPIFVKIKVFYGALVPEQATFRIEKRKPPVPGPSS
jgi:hypothetical protein